MSDLLLQAVKRQGTGEEVNGSSDSAVGEEKLNEMQMRYEEARRLSQKTVDEIKEDEVDWQSEDSLAASQRFFSSMALGWGDEIGLATAAAIASATTGNSYKDIYADMRKTYDAQQERFKERQPGVALTADIAGSIASPVNALKVAQAATKAGQAAMTGGRVAAEGAVYGAGEAKEGEIAEGAAKGAIGGLAGYGALRAAMKGAGMSVSAFTRRNVEGDLIDDAGEFVPITLAASKPDGVENLVHTFYRDVVAPSFGGKGTIKVQEEKIIGKASDYLESQKAFSRKLDEGLKTKAQEAKEQLSNASKQLEEQRKNLKSIASEESKGRVVPLKEKLSALKSGNAEEIAGKATSDVNKALNARRFDFRNRAFSEAVPAAASVKDIQRVLSIEDIGQRVRALDDLWSKKGYSMIKGKKIRVNKNEFERGLAEGITNDPVFKVLLPDIAGFKNNIMSAINNVDKFRDASNRIDGDVLSAIRSRLGTLAANAGEPQLRKGYYMAQGKIDDIIKKQLTPDQLSAFKKESQNWKSTVVLRDAIENTRVNAKKRGNFDESDWIKAASDNNNLDKRYGTGPLVREAHVLESNLQAAEKSIAKRASNLAKAKANMVEGTIRNHSAKLKKELESIDKTIGSQKARLRVDPSLQEDIAKNTLRKEQVSQEIRILEKNLKELEQLRSPKNPSWFHTLAATGVLASLVGAGFRASSIATGGALGKALATPTAQKIVAGQTAPQMAVQRMLSADATGRTADLLSRSVGRPVGLGGVGMFTEQ
jgi:hypothetical protein